MTRLKDPGAGEKDRGKRKDARMKAWKKPSSKKERDDARAERCKAWHGIPDEKPVETGKKVKN
jgi:hypothetical protein